MRRRGAAGLSREGAARAGATRRSGSCDGGVGRQHLHARRGRRRRRGVRRTRARDRVLVAPDDDRVDEPVAAAVGDVVVGEPEPPQVVRVVRQAEVDRQSPARDRDVPRRDRSRARPSARAASSLPGPRCSRATAGVLDGVTKYGWAPSVRSAASSSIFGPSAASTRARGRVGGAAKYGARPCASRYSRIVVSGWSVRRGRAALRPSAGGSRRARGGSGRGTPRVERLPAPRSSSSRRGRRSSAMPVRDHDALGRGEEQPGRARAGRARPPRASRSRRSPSASSSATISRARAIGCRSSV